MVLQQEELSLLDKKLEQWKQEEEVLRVSVEQHRQGLLDVLRQGEEDAQLLHQRIQVFTCTKYKCSVEIFRMNIYERSGYV